MIEKKLNNGATLVAEHVPSFRSVTAGIWTAAGSVTESKELNGISHLIEHMLFKGTTHRSAKQIAMDVDRIGGVINAFTSKESTCYYIQVMDEKLSEGLDILTDLFCNAVLDSEELKREKGVVLEEIAMSNDQPDDVVMDLIASTFFRGSSLEKTILGPPENIEAFSRSDLWHYMDRMYTSENVVVSVAGNFDEQRLVDALDTGLMDMRRHSRHLPDFSALEKYTYSPGTAFQHKDIEQVNLCLGLPGVSYRNERERSALRVLSSILGGSMSSRLFQKIREERGLAYSVYSHGQFYRDAGMFYIYSATQPKNLLEVVRLIREELEAVRAHGVTSEEIEQNKAMLKGNLVLSLESTSGRMSMLARNLLSGGRTMSEEEMIRSIDEVTAEDVAAQIEHSIDPERMSAAFVGAVGDEETVLSVLRG